MPQSSIIDAWLGTKSSSTSLHDHIQRLRNGMELVISNTQSDRIKHEVIPDKPFISNKVLKLIWDVFWVGWALPVSCKNWWSCLCKLRTKFDKNLKKIPREISWESLSEKNLWLWIYFMTKETWKKLNLLFIAIETLYEISRDQMC